MPANPHDDNFDVQAGGKTKVPNEKKEKFDYTTTLTVIEGEVTVSAKGPKITPTGCGNRCMIRVWTGSTATDDFTPVSSDDLTAASTVASEVDFARTLSEGDKIMYESDLEVTLSTTSGSAKVHRQRTTVQPA